MNGKPIVSNAEEMLQNRTENLISILLMHFFTTWALLLIFKVKLKYLSHSFSS